MLKVSVETGKNSDKHTAVVEVYGFERFTPRAARAALEIAGFFTGTARYQETDPSGEHTWYCAYRVYKNSARKIMDDVS